MIRCILLERKISSTIESWNHGMMEWQITETEIGNFQVWGRCGSCNREWGWSQEWAVRLGWRAGPEMSWQWVNRLL